MPNFIPEAERRNAEKDYYVATDFRPGAETHERAYLELAVEPAAMARQIEAPMLAAARWTPQLPNRASS